MLKVIVLFITVNLSKHAPEEAKFRVAIVNLSTMRKSVVLSNDTEMKDASGLLLRPKLNLRDTAGFEFHTLTIDEMPSHTHNYWYRWWGSGVQNRDAPSGDSWGKNDRDFKTTETGGTKPHNNMPPYMVLAYIMKL